MEVSTYHQETVLAQTGCFYPAVGSQQASLPATVWSVFLPETRRLLSPHTLLLTEPWKLPPAPLHSFVLCHYTTVQESRTGNHSGVMRLRRWWSRLGGWCVFKPYYLPRTASMPQAGERIWETMSRCKSAVCLFLRFLFLQRQQLLTISQLNEL